MLNNKLLKPYNSKETEPKIYEIWKESGYFNPDNLPGAQGAAFTIILPPPNATGVLHLGHALEDAMQDSMIRFHRMLGERALWLPGTDHAAIATEVKVTKILEKEGIKKKDLGRQKFLGEVDKFVEESRKIITSQLQKMGASLDWSRQAFTLDVERSLAVRTAFKKMHDEGLIYRGARTVNWDPKGQTVISDDEIIYSEQKTKFYTLKYGPFNIGTARPETKFGDKYVVMHPDDKRYEKYKHGDKLEVEWINGKITATVIKDRIIDMEFGTGVMTITPWHSHEDFLLAEKYKLEKEQIIDLGGRLLPIAGEFSGMKITEAREKVVEKLKEKNLVVSVDENYINNIATAERTGGIIEPQIMEQWFVNVNKKIPSRENKTLKELMIEPVRNGEIKILPERFEKIYFNWIENLRDWCISRQIWYGHRIPVWYKKNEIYVGIDAPEGKGWTQDEDTLDTWFSSGLWTFSTLGWPQNTEDLKKFHPTSIINPGYEILFFWVARMILMSQYLLGEIPFKIAYLHGILRDSKGQKFSKSLGNSTDPLEIIEKFGADALRMALTVGIGPGADSKFDIQKVKAYSKFANKIWNAARFVLSNCDNFDPFKEVRLTDSDKKHIENMDTVFKDVTADLQNMRFYLAAEKLYHYFWHTFADIVIEEAKVKLRETGEKKESAQYALFHILETSLKMLHPFMPFITEEIWSMLPARNATHKTAGGPNRKNLLLIEAWPYK